MINKKQNFKTVILALMIITLFLNILTVSAEKVFEINSEQLSQNSNIYYYYIDSFTSVDDNIPKEFKDTDRYIENYTITFFQPDEQEFAIRAKEAKITGKVDVMEEKTLHIDVADTTKLSTSYKLDIPLTQENTEKEILDNKNVECKKILRKISVNVFFAKVLTDTCFNNDSEIMPVKKSDILSLNNDVGIKSSVTQNFAKMYATIYAYDEYNGSQKRQSFSAYHKKYSTLNELAEGMNYVSTSLFDDKSDVITLAWSIGGAIGIYDPSISPEFKTI